jgi:hypothetical protein
MPQTEKVVINRVAERLVRKERNILLVVPPPVLAKNVVRAKVGAKRQLKGKKNEYNN